MRTEIESEKYERNFLAEGDDRVPANYPELYNLSAAFLFRFLARPTTPKKPEFLYIPLKTKLHICERAFIVAKWNYAWESAQLRVPIALHSQDIESYRALIPTLSALEDRNVYLLPDTEKRFEAYVPLFAMLPVNILDQFGLPAMRRMIWPSSGLPDIEHKEMFLPPDFRERFSNAFAYYIWQFIGGASSISSFSKSDSIRLLAHNPNYWLPHATRVIEEFLSTFEFVKLENKKDRQDIDKFRKIVRDSGDNDTTVDRCRKGGSIWLGEDEARHATTKMIDVADRNDQLKCIIDAVRSNRVEDDFSDRWSYAKEDFERKLYRKRSRMRVKFVELSEAGSVVGPESDISDSILWQDFLSILDTKERQIVVCLARDSTNLTDAARTLGYANHSPVSKALTKIRQKAEKLLDL